VHCFLAAISLTRSNNCLLWSRFSGRNLDISWNNWKNNSSTRNHHRWAVYA
jgi:hypothetical protein